jgi:hypothetical protein
MKNYHKNIATLGVITLLILIAISPIVSSIKIETNNLETSDIEEELVLLKGEHYFILKAETDVESFSFTYSFPPEYDCQTPIYLEILNDTNANITNYKIENDILVPNKFVNFTIGPMVENETAMIHFYFWVLIKNNDYSDFPEQVEIPNKEDLPSETHKWLYPTEPVQSNKFLIKLRARLLCGFNTNLVTLAERISKFCKQHRYGLFLLQYYSQRYFNQDALTTLFINGECPGRSHLGVALFRANGVPARIILANPTYPFWYEMHYMTEYYNPNYGWVLTEVHKSVTPYEPKNQIIQRICYPEDENNTAPDNYHPKMKYLEKWFWIPNENIKPVYKDAENISQIYTIKEKEIKTNEADAAEIVLVTSDAYNYYETCLGINLTGENEEYFENAISFQKQAINRFIDSEGGWYTYYMQKAICEYKKITP